MLIAAFDQRGVERTIHELEIKGYNLEDVSVIIRLDKEEMGKNDRGETVSFIQPEEIGLELEKILSLSPLLPSLGNFIISGPIAVILKLTYLQTSPSSNQRFPYRGNDELSSSDIQAVCGFHIQKDQAMLSGFLGCIGISTQNCYFFTQVVNSGGIVMIVPEYEEENLYEIFLSHGALRIEVLGNNTAPLKGQL